VGIHRPVDLFEWARVSSGFLDPEWYPLGDILDRSPPSQNEEVDQREDSLQTYVREVDKRYPECRDIVEAERFVEAESFVEVARFVEIEKFVEVERFVEAEGCVDTENG
jgi:hypothetical protein